MAEPFLLLSVVIVTLPILADTAHQYTAEWLGREVSRHSKQIRSAAVMCHTTTGLKSISLAGQIRLTFGQAMAF